MVNLVVERIPKFKGKVEVVELKGAGHPDSLSDALCEVSSVALSRYYIKQFGAVLHHNIDKGLIVAGKSEPKFGGGRIVEPIRVIISGRAVSLVGNVKIPVGEIVREAVSSYLKRFKGAEFDVEVDIRDGSGSLKGVFRRKVSVANDTSCGVSYYPLSGTESLAIKVRDLLESESFRSRFKAVGDDVKIMAVRVDKSVSLTVAVAFVCRYVGSMDEYVRLKSEISSFIRKSTGAKVFINTLDSNESESSVYLTVSGLSAEMGDDGQVGRGNRYNGIITPGRPMSIESFAGKNVSHPGKVYQVIASGMARDLVVKAGVGEAQVSIVSQIGKPLDEPFVVSVKVAGKIDLVRIKSIVDGCFRNIGRVQERLIFG